jgi:nucleoside-diphosphate-sugar epimerase
MQGKTVVITGGTSGIGAIAAQRLAQMGARIVLIARSKARGRVALARLNERSRGLAHISRFAWLAKLIAISPEQGAETIVYLASSPAVAEATGEYFYKRQSIAPSPVAQDDRVATLLWERSADLAGLIG